MLSRGVITCLVLFFIRTDKDGKRKRRRKRRPSSSSGESDSDDKKLDSLRPDVTIPKELSRQPERGKNVVIKLSTRYQESLQTNCFQR